MSILDTYFGAAKAGPNYSLRVLEKILEKNGRRQSLSNLKKNLNYSTGVLLSRTEFMVSPFQLVVLVCRSPFKGDHQDAWLKPLRMALLDAVVADLPVQYAHLAPNTPATRELLNIEYPQKWNYRVANCKELYGFSFDGYVLTKREVAAIILSGKADPFTFSFLERAVRRLNKPTLAVLSAQDDIALPPKDDLDDFLSA